MERRASSTDAMLAAGVLAAVASLSVAGFTRALPVEHDRPVEPGSTLFPDWFLPIWDAYDRNPAVTPDFDFASLYSRPPAPASPLRGG